MSVGKCCEKCAFRAGSPERQDGYGWANLADGWEDGDPFYCHEGVPGHHQEVHDSRPCWRVCEGWKAHKAGGFRNVMKLAVHTPDPEVDAFFGAIR